MPARLGLCTSVRCPDRHPLTPIHSIRAFFYYTRHEGIMTRPTGIPEGMAFPPSLKDLGIVPGAKIDIRDLEEIRKRYGFEVYLYFEEELARGSTVTEDIQEYNDVPDLERPFIELDAFLQFATESDPLFTRRLDELPLVVEIIAYGEVRGEGEEPVEYVKGLMPFLDELEVEDIPAGM
jgi:hypothetical protein